MGRSSEYVLRIFHPTALIPVYMVRRGTLAERRACRFRRRVVRKLHGPTPGVKQHDRRHEAVTSGWWRRALCAGQLQPIGRAEVARVEGMVTPARGHSTGDLQAAMPRPPDAATSRVRRPGPTRPAPVRALPVSLAAITARLRQTALWATGLIPSLQSDDRFGWFSAGPLPGRDASRSDIRFKAGPGPAQRPHSALWSDYALTNTSEFDPQAFSNRNDSARSRRNESPSTVSLTFATDYNQKSALCAGAQWRCCDWLT